MNVQAPSTTKQSTEPELRFCRRLSAHYHNNLRVYLATHISRRLTSVCDSTVTRIEIQPCSQCPPAHDHTTRRLRQKPPCTLSPRMLCSSVRERGRSVAPQVASRNGRCVNVSGFAHADRARTAPEIGRWNGRRVDRARLPESHLCRADAGPQVLALKLHEALDVGKHSAQYNTSLTLVHARATAETRVAQARVLHAWAQDKPRRKPTRVGSGSEGLWRHSAHMRAPGRGLRVCR